MFDVRPVVDEKKPCAERDADNRRRVPGNGDHGTGGKNEDQPKRSNKRDTKEAIHGNPYQTG
jgi:hypothetical protein